MPELEGKLLGDLCRADAGDGELLIACRPNHEVIARRRRRVQHQGKEPSFTFVKRTIGNNGNGPDSMNRRIRRFYCTMPSASGRVPTTPPGWLAERPRSADTPFGTPFAVLQATLVRSAQQSRRRARRGKGHGTADVSCSYGRAHTCGGALRRRLAAHVIWWRPGRRNRRAPDGACGAISDHRGICWRSDPHLLGGLLAP